MLTWGRLLFIETGLGTHDVVTGQDHALLQYHGTTVAIVVDLGARRHPACGSGLDVGGLIDHVELQGRGGPQDLLGTGGVLDTGQLDDDALAALLLDQRLGHTQFVHPVTDDGDVLLEGVLLHFLDLGFTQTSQQDEVIPFLLCGEGKIRILPTQEGGGLGLIGLLAEHHLHLITRPGAHRSSGSSGVRSSERKSCTICSCCLASASAMSTSIRKCTPPRRSRPSFRGAAPMASSQAGVEGARLRAVMKLSPSLLATTSRALSWSSVLVETDQDETVLERSMLDRDLSRFERLLHLIERL